MEQRERQQVKKLLRQLRKMGDITAPPSLMPMIQARLQAATPRAPYIADYSGKGKNPLLRWPGADDAVIVEEMLRDNYSEHWHECREFVKKLVQNQARNMARQDWEDIVQEVMIRVHRSLAGFWFGSSLRTWLFQITRNCIIDLYRRKTRPGQSTVPLEGSHNAREYEFDALTPTIRENVEDICIQHDEIHTGLKALEQYAAAHASSERNRKILEMVIFEGRSLEEAAKTAGCSSAVAGYVVRQAQRFAREKRNQEG